MKVEKLSAVAELVSSVAIVITLGYLAIQTQQNTVAMQATVRQAMLTDDRELLFRQIEYPLLVAARTGDTDLSDEEFVRLGSYLVRSNSGESMAPVQEWCHRRENLGDVPDCTRVSARYRIREILVAQSVCPR
jgi:hypothetical protein